MNDPVAHSRGRDDAPYDDMTLAFFFSFFKTAIKDTKGGFL